MGSVNVGKAATYAGGGAALGTAVVPGIGTAIGGIGGAAYSVLSDLLGGSSPSATPPNPANFQLGQGNGANYTNEVAGALSNRGNVVDQTGAGLSGQAAGAYGAAALAQGQTAPQIQQDLADRQRTLAALGGTVSSAGSLTGAANQLQQLGTDGMPMGLAEAQLRQGQDANMNQALAMAHSGRTLGGGAAALRQAEFQNAQTGQVTNQQAASANIQEQQQNQQFKLNALGGAQQGYGAAGGLYGQAGTQAGGINQTDLGVQQTNAGLQQQQAGIDNQTSATFGSIGQGLNSSALGYGQLGEGYQGQGLDAIKTQLTANMQLGGASAQNSQFNTTNAINQNTQTQATTAAGLQGVAQIVGGAGGSSTPAAGTNPNNPSGSTSPYQNIGTSSGGAGPGTASDRDVKTGIQPANMALALHPGASSASILPAASAFLANAQAHGTAPIGTPSASTIRPTLYQAPPDPFGLNAPMPSGSPSHLVPNLPPGMASSLAALSGGQPGGGGGGAASPELPNGATGGDPYLAAIAGANKQYLPSGYWDPTVVMGAPNTVGATISYAPPGLDQAIPIQPGPATADPGAALQLANAKAGVGSPHGAAPAPGWGSPGPVTNPSRASDVRSKTRIQQLESQLAALQPPSPQQPDTASLDDSYRSQGGTTMTGDPAVDLRPAQGYSYEYKDPDAHGQGRFFGPMAQDLERTPAGASTVKRAPDGTKMVDTSRLSLVNTSAISEQQRKIQEMQRQLAALSRPQMEAIQRGYPASYPTAQAPY